MFEVNLHRPSDSRYPAGAPYDPEIECPAMKWDAIGQDKQSTG
jgi:hypothetical protein